MILLRLINNYPRGGSSVLVDKVCYRYLIITALDAHGASVCRCVQSCHPCFHSVSLITQHAPFGKCPTDRMFAGLSASYTAVSVGQHPSFVVGITIILLVLFCLIGHNAIDIVSAEYRWRYHATLLNPAPPCFALGVRQVETPPYGTLYIPVRRGFGNAYCHFTSSRKHNTIPFLENGANLYSPLSLHPHILYSAYRPHRHHRHSEALFYSLTRKSS